MTEQEFLRILRFYAACVEAEDRRSLTKRLASLHHSLVSPWDAEPFFHPEDVEVVFEAPLDQNLLLGGAALAGGPERFFYGYPVFLDQQGMLSPLFVAEVEVQHRGGDCFVMRSADAGEIQLNHHVFHAQPEELRAIQAELEGEYGSFADRLRAAFEALGVQVPDFAADQLEPYPNNNAARDRWVNRPILFKSERSAYTHHLRRELDSLARYPRLLSAVGSTAAGALAGITAVPRHGASMPALVQVVPLNRLQEEAARAGLEATLTVVTGPPGTGKSQVVIDILASCALAGRPVLFASKNNKAVDVVRKRLRTILGEERDWTLRFGNRKAMDEARQEMSARLGALRPEAVPPVPAPQLFHELDKEIAATRRRLEQLERDQLKYAGLERDRRFAEVLVEPDWVELWDRVDGLFPDPTRVELCTATADSLAGIRPCGFWLKVKRALAPTWLRRRVRAELTSLSELLPEQVQADLSATADQPGGDRFNSLAKACGKLARLTLWLATEDACRRALGSLNSAETAEIIAGRLDDAQRRRAELTCDQFRSAWTARLAGRAASVQHALGRYFDLSLRLQENLGGEFLPVLDQFKRAVLSLGTDLPVWVVTNLSVRNALPLEPALFDLVIIDEASQCDIPSVLPLLFRARRAIIIGDPQQLRHISTLSTSEEENLAALHNVEQHIATWSYNRCSVYALSEDAIRGRGGEPLLLAEHYRSHPEIIEFSNKEFYGGQLILRTNLPKLRERLQDQPLGVFWHDVPGLVPSTQHSAVNDIEVRAVLDLLDEWERIGFLLRDGVDFGIVTPFRLQMERLKKAVLMRPWWESVKGRLTVGTAHRFQGDECDVMIFSPVVATGMRPNLVDWVAKTSELLNVAITRARGALHVVGDQQFCRTAGGVLGKFAAHAGEGAGWAVGPLLFESPAEARMAELLAETGLWYAPQHDVGPNRLDFLVVTPFGTRYDIEVDGRGHLAEEAIRRDEGRDARMTALGLKVLRFNARRVFNNADAIRELLRRLV